MEYYGSYISMNGKTIQADTRKELEDAMIETGAEPAVARTASRLLWENMLDTQIRIAQEFKDKNETAKQETSL